MSKSRIKINLPTLTTRTEAEAAMNELAQAENNKRLLITDRDEQVLKIQEARAGTILECEEFVAARTDALRAWAEAHPEEFAKGRKSIDFAAGTLGFRTGTPKLKLLRGWKWDKVLAAIKTLGLPFVRTKEEVDKEAIITAATTENLNPREQLAIGVKVDQDESFFIEPKLTETDSRKTA